MTTDPLPIEEVTRRALDLLFRELGPADTFRFLNRWRTGAGDYTAERDQLFAGLTLKQIVADIEAARAAPATGS